jgi:MarR family transcriptional regulator, organic hydroperoxide resistance regulator
MQPLVDETMQVYVAVSRALLMASAPAWANLDLTMAQLRGLFAVANEGPLSIGQVATAVGIAPPKASLLVDQLVQAALIERDEDPTDRRRMLTRITPAGADLVERLRHGRLDHLRAGLEQLSDSDRAALLQGLQALAGTLAADRATMPVAVEPD